VTARERRVTFGAQSLDGGRLGGARGTQLFARGRRWVGDGSAGGRQISRRGASKKQNSYERERRLAFHTICFKNMGKEFFSLDLNFLFCFCGEKLNDSKKYRGHFSVDIIASDWPRACAVGSRIVAPPSDSASARRRSASR
jgi:hypothetical protein